MQINYIFPHWGQKGKPIPQLIEKVKAAGYTGMEINVASTGVECADLVDALKDNGLIFIAQQWLPPLTETVDEHLYRFEKNLETIAELKPHFINSHTGKDFFSFIDNCKVILKADEFTRRTGVDIYHETHRGRFAFHSGSILPYLETFPGLKFTADLSHWCTVSESLLQDQQAIIDVLIPKVKYIHARVGHEHSPQVNDPKAPEWGGHVQRFLTWWDAIVEHNFTAGNSEMFICPEFGPVPYMPTMPYSREPLADQWELNDWMMNLLRDRYQKYTKFETPPGM